MSMPLNAKQYAYRDLALHFCKVLEDSTSKLLTIRSVLVALYAASLDMPEVADSDAALNLPQRISFNEYLKLKKSIETRLRLDLFAICYYPFKSPPETPVWASLSDGLADIWSDLKRGLLALEHDEEKWASTVFWDWNFSFESHWGHHAVDCIWAIHKLTRDNSAENGS